MTGHHKRHAGFTLVELLIAITLVAALSTGMLLAMRTGLQTVQKVDDRLTANRRVLSVQQILQHQISNAFPALGQCGDGGGSGLMFRGTPQSLLLVSSYSMTEGARGLPRVLVFQVIPSDQGVRLIVNESLYYGPQSTAPFCLNGLPFAQPGPQSFVLADHLAYCKFVYEIGDPESPRPKGWVNAWSQPLLPYAVRVDMVPLMADPAHLPLLPVTARIGVTRDPTVTYNDSWQ